MRNPTFYYQCVVVAVQVHDVKLRSTGINHDGRQRRMIPIPLRAGACSNDNDRPAPPSLLPLPQLAATSTICGDGASTIIIIVS
jgi:hypothetical protein